MNRLEEEESNKVTTFSRPHHPTHQPEIQPQYIPRDPPRDPPHDPPRNVVTNAACITTRDSSHDVTNDSSREVTRDVSLEVEPDLSNEINISAINLLPVEPGFKRESSCSDSGVDVTSLSVC